MNLPIVNWRFLDEPAYRWALFLIMVGLFLGVWGEVLRHMGVRRE